MVKEHFVKKIAYDKDDNCNEDVFAAKKENDHMFLTTSKFNFYAWCKSVGCRLQKLMFPYEWLDSLEKLRHVGPVSYEDF